MKRVFYSPFVAIAVGLCLRLFFVLKFPSTSGDTFLYEQIATNWLKHGAYAMDVGGAITPVDVRMPGYPAFLAFIYALTGRTGESARLPVMLAQVTVDLLTCLLIAALAALLTSGISNRESGKRVFTAALSLAVLCPFTANYTAVPLTEVFAMFFTSGALYYLVLQLRRIEAPLFQWNSSHADSRRSVEYTGIGAGFLAGLGTLFRPETPLLLIAAALVLFGLFFRRREGLRWLRVVAVLGASCFLPLLPWGIRNMVTLDEPQFLAPRNSNLPGELVPRGFMNWEKTWLFRISDCYRVTWKLNDEVINLEDIPARAFDTPEEKAQVTGILEQYNDDLTLTPEEDAAFAQLARERTARHLLRTYLWLPAARAVTLWFSPRIERLPYSGHVFPLGQTWEDDPVDQSVTISLFLLNILYVALAIWGALRLWRGHLTARPAVTFFVVFFVLRTAFLTTVEAPEPRYMLVCFPALIALAAQLFARPSES
jgi:glycosyl transferase family 22 (putative mannosyltransferase)